MRLATLVPLLLTLAAALPGTATAASQSPQLAFFENRIRPVLAEHCYRCHNSSGTKKARLALDYRAGLRRGGASGPAMVVGNAAESLLIRAIRHQHPKLRMPKEGPKLSDAVVRDFEHWIDSGAADPRDEPPAATKLAATLNWDAMLRRRQQWWSF
ncbi:MAG: cytochrome c553, partial [Candidatus Azotimanducaceae bacterium]